MRRTAAPGRTISAADSSHGRTEAGSSRRLVGVPARAAIVALVGLFIIALFAVLYVARAFVVPIVLAMQLALVLCPAVRALRRLGLPGPAGAALVLFGLLVAAGAGFYLLAGPTGVWMEKLPESFRMIEYRIRDVRKPVEVMRRAADEMRKIAAIDAADKPAPVVEVKNHDAMNTLVSGTHTLLAGIGLTALALYFFLGWGDLFLRKLIRVLPTLAGKKRAVEIARETQRQISAYLLTITLVNALLGAAVGGAVWLLGVPNPALWGAMAFVLNFIPFLGPLTGIVVLGVVAMVTFAGLGQALLVPAVYFLLHSVESQHHHAARAEPAAHAEPARDVPLAVPLVLALGHPRRAPGGAHAPDPQDLLRQHPAARARGAVPWALAAAMLRLPGRRAAAVSATKKWCFAYGLYSIIRAKH